jgi:hypothetical protein
LSRRAGSGSRVTGAAAGALRQVLEQLSVAKRELRAASEALRAVEGRLRSPFWDLRAPFMARRGRALHDEATLRFSRALDGLHALLVSVTERTLPGSGGGGGSAPPRGPRVRRLLAEIRQELRSMQRAFDGGSLLLASALETFGGAPR